MFQILLRSNSQVATEGKDCTNTPPCLFKNTCWAAWLISSSFSRLPWLRGADYQEELIPDAPLISLIRAPGRWLEGSYMSHGCTSKTVCTGMLAAMCYTEESGTKIQWLSKIEWCEMAWELWQIANRKAICVRGNFRGPRSTFKRFSKVLYIAKKESNLSDDCTEKEATSWLTSTGIAAGLSLNIR